MLCDLYLLYPTRFIVFPYTRQTLHIDTISTRCLKQILKMRDESKIWASYLWIRIITNSKLKIFLWFHVLKKSNAILYYTWVFSSSYRSYLQSHNSSLNLNTCILISVEAIIFHRFFSHTQHYTFKKYIIISRYKCIDLYLNNKA